MAGITEQNVVDMFSGDKDRERVNYILKTSLTILRDRCTNNVDVTLALRDFISKHLNISNLLEAGYPKDNVVPLKKLCADAVNYWNL